MTEDTRAEAPAPKDLNASSALIVGGTAGIGLASARALAAAGVPRIAIVGRNVERGQLAAKSIAELGAAAHFVAGDASDANAAIAVAAEADRIDERPVSIRSLPASEASLLLEQLQDALRH